MKGPKYTGIKKGYEALFLSTPMDEEDWGDWWQHSLIRQNQDGSVDYYLLPTPGCMEFQEEWRQHAKSFLLCLPRKKANKFFENLVFSEKIRQREVTFLGYF